MPVLEIPPYWSKPVKHQWKRDLAVLDNASGIKTFDDQTDYPHTFQDYHWVEQGRPNITQLREWLFYRKGKLVEFWSCTFQKDMTLYSPITPSSSTMVIQNIGYSRFISQAVSRKDIRIELYDGTVYYRRITGSTEIDNLSEALTVDSVFPSSILENEVRQISYMYLARLDSETLDRDWETVPS